MRRRLAIIAAGTDTRMGGVERFSSNLEEALEGDHDIERLSPSRIVPRGAARFGLKDACQSRDATREFGEGTFDLGISNGTLGWGSPKTIPRIHVFHGTSPTSAWRNKALPRRERIRSGVSGGVAEWLGGRTVTTVAVSRSAAEEVHRLYRIKVDAVIENGIDTRLFAPRDQAEARRRLGLREGQKVALFVGRAEPRKGSGVALEAARAAGFTLAVAGARPVEGATNLGLLSPDELSWAYSAADCVLFPTSYEACSFVILEALACGVPLITTPTAWARDLGARVGGYSELLVPPRVKEITAALQTVRDSRLDSLVTAGRELVEASNSLDSFGSAWRELATRAIRG
ncbi:glycosyltransferase family 4 protein [Demequina sp. SO4-13]|uniref:glycosyltransferase family 4 protein n=1 Tax=Demequina sp. SO4-13 TaxID=3401027 RepID=UPI003AF84BAD